MTVEEWIADTRRLVESAPVGPLQVLRRPPLIRARLRKALRALETVEFVLEHYGERRIPSALVRAAVEEGLGLSGGTR